MSESIAALQARAQAGDVRALAALGRKLVTADGVRPAPKDGVAMLSQAAQRGDADANEFLARIAAWGAFEPRDPSKALDLLQRAAELGAPHAQAELRVLARAASDDWAQLRRSVDAADFTRPPPRRTLSESPRLRVFEGFATPQECDWLIACARGDLHRAQVYQGSSALQVSDTRTNSEAGYLLRSSGVAVALVRDRIAAAANVAPDFCEVTKLLHYEVGQTYRPHLDCFDPVAMPQELQARGQRVATFLLYLNDDFDGGETEFPAAGIRYKGRKGDGLLFINVDTGGAPDPLTVHTGLPPTRGEKWLLSQWIRSQSINAFMTPGLSAPPLTGDWLRAA